jgi:hypothetical protein
LQVLPDAPSVPPLVDVKTHSILTSIEVLVANLFSDEGVGFTVGLLSVMGFVALLYKRTARSVFLPLITLFCIYLFAVASHRFPGPRHLNTLYPFLAVLAAYGLIPLLDRSPQLRRFGMVALTGLLLVPLPFLPLRAVIDLNRERLTEDVRSRVHVWLREHLAENATIISDHDVVPLRISVQRCQWVIDVCKAQAGEYRDLANRVEAKNAQQATDLRRIAGIYDDKRAEWGIRKTVAQKHPEGRFDAIPFEHAWMAEKLIMRRHSVGSSNPVPCRSPWGHYLTLIIIEAEERIAHLSAEEKKEALLPAAHAVQRFQEMLAQDFRADLLKQAQALAAAAGHEPDLAAANREADRRIKDLSRSFGLGIDERPAIVELWRQLTPVSKSWLIKESVRDESGHVTEKHKPAEWFVSVKDFYDRYDSPHKRTNFPDWAALYDDLKSHYRCVEFGSNNSDPKQVVRVWDLRERLPKGDHVLRVP